VSIALESAWNFGLLDSRAAGSLRTCISERRSIMAVSRYASLAPRIVAFATMLFVLQVPSAQAAGKCRNGTVPLDVKCGIPVTTEFYSDSAFTISQDGGGAYPHGVNGVKTGLLDDGNNGLKHDWRFDVRGSTRNITETLNMSDRITSGPHFIPWEVDPPYWGTQPSQGQMNVQCTFVGVDMLAMSAAEVRTCPLINSFYYNGADYWGLHALKSFYQGPPETTDVQVACNSADSLGCNDWSITPINDPGIGLQAVGRLMHNKVTGKSGRAVLEPGGSFYMRFYVHVTRP
jgi:hypothetical protein